MVHYRRHWIFDRLLVLLLVPIASLLELETLHKIVPQLAEFLQEHAILKSLVQTGLPTLAFSLLTVAVPYVYECGFISGYAPFVFMVNDTRRAFEQPRNGVTR